MEPAKIPQMNPPRAGLRRPDYGPMQHRVQRRYPPTPHVKKRRMVVDERLLESLHQTHIESSSLHDVQSGKNESESRRGIEQLMDEAEISFSHRVIQDLNISKRLSGRFEPPSEQDLRGTQREDSLWLDVSYTQSVPSTPKRESRSTAAPGSGRRSSRRRRSRSATRTTPLKALAEANQARVNQLFSDASRREYVRRENHSPRTILRKLTRMEGFNPPTQPSPERPPIPGSSQWKKLTPKSARTRHIQMQGYNDDKNPFLAEPVLPKHMQPDRESNVAATTAQQLTFLRYKEDNPFLDPKDYYQLWEEESEMARLNQSSRTSFGIGQELAYDEEALLATDAIDKEIGEFSMSHADLTDMLEETLDLGNRPRHIRNFSLISNSASKDKENSTTRAQDEEWAQYQDQDQYQNQDYDQNQGQENEQRQEYEKGQEYEGDQVYEGQEHEETQEQDSRKARFLSNELEGADQDKGRSEYLEPQMTDIHSEGAETVDHSEIATPPRPSGDELMQSPSTVLASTEEEYVVGQEMDEDDMKQDELETLSTEKDEYEERKHGDEQDDEGQRHNDEVDEDTMLKSITVSAEDEAFVYDLEAEAFAAQMEADEAAEKAEMEADLAAEKAELDALAALESQDSLEQDKEDDPYATQTLQAALTPEEKQNETLEHGQDINAHNVGKDDTVMKNDLGPFESQANADENLELYQEQDVEAGGQDPHEMEDGYMNVDDENHIEQQEHEEQHDGPGTQYFDDFPSELGIMSNGEVLSVSKPLATKGPHSSASGVPVPSMPTSLQKQLVHTFSRSRISQEAMQVILEGSDFFFEQVAGDLAAYANHAGRRTIDESDVEVLMQRLRITNDKVNMESLLHRYLPRELRDLVLFPSDIRQIRRR
ncbi:hypothetical protein BGZ94_007242 [Podila epigama]|nr:hypothetical protein BGZ94_007242 [Podila epigama]